MILFFVLSLFTNYLVPIARIVAVFIVTRITPGAFISLRSIREFDSYKIEKHRKAA